MKKELIHTRTIKVNCYETDGASLVVEGYLLDERLFPYWIHALAERRDAGPMHHFVLAMELSVPELKILSLETQMPVTPDEGCRDIRGTMQKLVGRCIRPGFTNEVKGLIGRGTGCLHLTQLLLAMSSAAVQGMWTIFSRDRQGERPPFPGIEPSLLLDSCYMWRENGPFVGKIRRRQAELREKRYG